MALDKRGELWVGTFCGIAKFSNEKFISYVSPLSKNSSDRTHQIILDNKGALWFYIYNEGIARLNNY
jgi:ligand-binding sensor domain-containing protein